MADTDPLRRDPIGEGVRLFNEGYFFEAHDVLEDAWHAERGEPRVFLQGLIQICAGFHHLQNGNVPGALALLARGMDKIRTYPDAYLGLDVKTLLAQVEDARRRIAISQGGGPAGFEFPKIELGTGDGSA